MSANNQSGRGQFSAQEMILLCETLDAIRKAGVPLDFGLTQSVASLPPRLGETLQRIAERVGRGMPLEQALDEERQVPSVFRAVFAIGLEKDGTGRLFRDVAETSRHFVELRLAMRRGFVYPLLVVLVAVGMASLLFLYLLPQLLSTYESLNAPLPPWAAAIQQVSGWFTSSMATMAALVIAAVLVYLFWSAESPRGLSWEAAVVFPGFGKILQYGRAARVAHLLSLLIDHGVPMPRALRLAGEAAGTPRYRLALEQLAVNIEAGRSFEEATREGRLLPPLLQWLMRVGEHDSRLGATLREAAGFYRHRALSRAEWFARLVPTLAMIVIGGGVTLGYGLMLFGPLAELWEKLGTP